MHTIRFPFALVMALATLPVAGSAITPAVPRAAAAGEVTLTSAQADGIRVAEVSGLAWDAIARRLYAVSDQGFVYRFRVRIERNRLAAVTPEFAAPLVAASGPSSRKHFNAEGLALHRDAAGRAGLLVALEENPPRITRFNTDGVRDGQLAVPPPANDIRVYEKKGRGLESVAWHTTYGLMTAPEAPLTTQPSNRHTIYADGHAWSFLRHADGSRLKGFDVLPDGSLLVLERSRPSGSKHAQVASLRRVDLTQCDKSRVCQTQLLWSRAVGDKNFEGMTLLDAHHVLLASDDGGDAAQGTTFQLIVLP